MLSCLFDIPRGFTGLESDLLSAWRSLGLNRERRCNGSVCESTAKLITALEVDILILSLCLDIRSLLRMMILIGGSCTLLPRCIAKLAFNALDLDSLLDNRLLLREVILIGNTDNIVV